MILTEVQLGKTKTLFIDGDRSSRYPKREEFTDSGVMFLNAASINSGAINKNEANYISQRKYSEIKKGRIARGDTLLTTRGNGVGDTAFVDINEEGLINAQMLILRPDSREIDSLFLYYYFSSKSLKTYIWNFASGSAQPQIPIRDLKKIPLFLPSLVIQRKISAVLVAYDDLIKVNNRRIQLLENMAEEIYKDWFVRLRFPGYENVKVVKGLPKGWKLQSFSALVEINPKEKVDPKQTRPYVGMDRLSEQYMYFDSKESRKSTAGAKFRNNDVIFPRITPCLENGKRGYVFCLGQDEVAVGSTEFIVFREQQLPSEYIYLLTCYQPFRRHAENFMVGASGRQRVSADCFDFFFLPLPPKDLLDSFVDKVKPFFGQIKNLHLENKNLVETRDKLLPRLISGKLSVENLDINFPPSMEEVLA